MLCFMNFWLIQFIENLLCGDIYNYYDVTYTGMWLFGHITQP